MNIDESPRPDAPARGCQEELLEQLAGVLTEQRTQARQGDLRAVQDLIGESDRLLRELAGTGPLSPPSAARLGEIVQVHRQVEITLVSAREQTAERLARLRRGKGALRGYGGR
jgi:hypothetical protein